MFSLVGLVGSPLAVSATKRFGQRSVKSNKAYAGFYYNSGYIGSSNTENAGDFNSAIAANLSRTKPWVGKPAAFAVMATNSFRSWDAGIGNLVNLSPSLVGNSIGSGYLLQTTLKPSVEMTGYMQLSNFN